MSSRKRNRTRPVEVFLSHSVKDKRFLKRIPARSAAISISRAWARSRANGFSQTMCRPAAIASRWVKREVAHAIEEPRFDGRIIPLRISACSAKELSWVLPQIQTIDFIGRFDDACRELFAIWGISYHKEGSP